MAASNLHLSNQLGMVKLELANMVRDGKHPPDRIVAKEAQVKRLESTLRRRGVLAG